MSTTESTYPPLIDQVDEIVVKISAVLRSHEDALRKALWDTDNDDTVGKALAALSRISEALKRASEIRDVRQRQEAIALIDSHGILALLAYGISRDQTVEMLTTETGCSRAVAAIAYAMIAEAADSGIDPRREEERR